MATDDVVFTGSSDESGPVSADLLELRGREMKPTVTMVLSVQVGGRLPPESAGPDSNRVRFKDSKTRAKRNSYG